MRLGDNEQVAKGVVVFVRISDVSAGRLPEEKLKVIDELLKDDGGVVNCLLAEHRPLNFYTAPRFLELSIASKHAIRHQHVRQLP